MVKDAAAFTGDPAKRIQMFQDAEKLLVTEAPGVFIYHRYQSDLYKSYLKGSELDPDQIHVPGVYVDRLVRIPPDGIWD